jgi:threonine aldolase
MNRRGFASDNNSGVHPEILNAFNTVNDGHTIGYGDDVYTQKAINKIKKIFGQGIDVYFVLTGTAANTLGFKAVTKSYNSVICAETAHINQDECGAPEKFTGCKIISVPTKNGKLTPELVGKHIHGIGFEHHSQPKVITITQCTEVGTVYTPAEIHELSEFAHRNGMLLHIDGARLFNAAASLNLSLMEITKGADLLSFGGTKNGMMFGEALIFFDKKLSEDFKYYRKQGMQLFSKMRFLSVQFEAILSNELWRKNAEHSNKMAKLLAEKVAEIPNVKLTQKVESNGVFVMIPKESIEPLQKEYFFYVWDEHNGEVRWMCSWDTTEEDVNGFVELLKNLV